MHLPYNRNNPTENDKKLIEIVKEINIFRKLMNTPNIVNCFGICLCEGEVLICMEEMDMSLKDLICKLHEVDLTNDVHLQDLHGCIIIAIVDALIACQKENLLHRNIKPTNLLLNKSGEIKLCDFSEIRILEADGLASTFTGFLTHFNTLNSDEF